MAKLENFWTTKIGAESEKAPITVVREVAMPLSDATKGLLEAAVRTSSDQNGFLVHTLRVSAPTIKFSIPLATFRHRAIPIYPVWAVAERVTANPYRSGSTVPLGIEEQFAERWLRAPQSEPPGQKLADETTLREWLRVLVQDQTTTELVNGLLLTLQGVSSVAPFEEE
jgi:hypothetical protein